MRARARVHQVYLIVHAAYTTYNRYRMRIIHRQRGAAVYVTSYLSQVHRTSYISRGCFDPFKFN